MISEANSARAVVAASRSASSAAIDSAASVGEIVAFAVESCDRANLEIGDLRLDGVEPPALLLVLGDGERQCPLGPLDRRRRVAHLLIEDEKGSAALQLFSGGSDGAAK